MSVAPLALHGDEGSQYNGDTTRRKKSKRKGKHKYSGNPFGGGGFPGGVEHFREYSPTPDYMMNPFERPPSEQLTDLHVYIVPPEYWDDQHNCAFNTVMNFTTSVGFVRVYPETRLSDLRAVLIDQVMQSGGVLPHKFVFLKSVGRALTLVKDQQEQQLKVKNFLPPFAYAPELFLMTRDRITGDKKSRRQRDLPIPSQVPQHKYVPLHHTQQPTQRHGAVPPMYPPQTQQSQYGGGGGHMSYVGVGGQHFGSHGGFHGAPNMQLPHNGYANEPYRGRQNYAMTPSAAIANSQMPVNQSYPTHRTSHPLQAQAQKVPDNRVFPPQSTYYPGFEGYQTSKRVGYPMEYGPPMSASPPETAFAIGLDQTLQGQQPFKVDPVALSLEDQRGGGVNPEMTMAGFTSSQQERTATSSTQSSDQKIEMSLDEREKLLAKQERDLEKKKEDKERKLEEKMRQTEMQTEQALRDLEKRLSEEQRRMEESKYSMEKDLQDQRDQQDKALMEMQRNLERQQQQESYKQQKEMDDMLREQEKKFVEKQREMESRLRDQEKELRQKFVVEERKLAEKERELEKAKMELEKTQLEKEKEQMKMQNSLQKAKMEMKREKQAIAKEEKQQIANERADAVSRMGQMAEEGDSRPGSSPPKMKFPRAKTPDLLEEFQKKLLEIARIKEERKEVEAARDGLIRKAYNAQAKAAQRRAQARDNWKKQYFEEKKKTLPLEEHAQKLRKELDNLNRRVINRLEKEADAQHDSNLQASHKLAQHKIVYTRLQNELDDSKQKIEEMQLRLLGEIKRRIQCEREIKCLHRELYQLRITNSLPPPPAEDSNAPEE